MRTISKIAPAKINLALHVTGQRRDGYHLLESLVTFTEFGDLLTFEQADRSSLKITGTYATGLSNGPDNLVNQACQLWQDHTGLHSDFAITLVKNLPAASGIGGGSSDAATTLRVLNQINGNPLSPVRLAELGGTLGADLPMCVFARPLVAAGIGETIDTNVNLPALPIVLVNPLIPISTPQVFGQLGGKFTRPFSPVSADWVDVETVCTWLVENTTNSLQSPAQTLTSAITPSIEILSSTRPLLVRMSGSGASCFGVFPSSEQAEEAAGFIREQKPDWFVCATKTMGQ